jgi:hypothetical protein
MVKRFDCQVAVTVNFQLRFELSESRKRVGKQTVERECQLFYGPAYNLVLVVYSTCCGSSAIGLAGVVLGRRSASGRLLICWGQLKPETLGPTQAGNRCERRRLRKPKTPEKTPKTASQHDKELGKPQQVAISIKHVSLPTIRLARAT